MIITNAEIKELRSRIEFLEASLISALDKANRANFFVDALQSKVEELKLQFDFHAH